MSTIKHPVGPQPGKVYWRRRLVVGLGLLAVVLVIVLIVVRPGSGAPAGDTGTIETSPPPPADEDAAASADPTACDPEVLTLEAVTDRAGYNAGEQPQLSLSLTNTGDVSCTIQAGSDVQEFRILSGEEQYWSSKDCQVDPVPAAATLEPGVPVSTTPIPWNRTRSSVDTCASTDLPDVPAGGASYHLTVFVGELESVRSKQFLLY